MQVRSVILDKQTVGGTSMEPSCETKQVKTGVRIGRGMPAEIDRYKVSLAQNR